MHWLDSVAKHHNDYIRFVNKMGNTSHAEDLVQEMYLRLNKYHKAIKFKQDGSVSKSYIYRILYNMSIDYNKSANRFFFTEISECRSLESEQPDSNKFEAYERILESVEENLNTLDEPDKYPYNKELLSLYINTGLSMRAISSLTGISLTSIHWTIKKCKEQINYELGEDLQDYINQDYERI